MISRRTALAIAKVYEATFADSYVSNNHRTYKVDVNELYDFLFEHDHSAWLCNLSKSTHNYSSTKEDATRKLREFILKLHTGETQAKATPEWTWKQREKLGQQYLHDLAEDILNKYDQRSGPVQELLRTLELDGYIYRNSLLLAPESDVIDVEEETGVLKNLYSTLVLGNKETAFHHLSLSEEHYINKKWDDSISNSRKFLECVLQEVSARHFLKMRGIPITDDIYSKPVRIRDYLESENLLEAKEKNVVASVYGLLSETGSHPYMAKNDQARLLRQLALTISQFVMLRFQGMIAKTQ